MDAERVIQRDRLVKTLMKKLRLRHQTELIGITSVLTDKGDKIRLMRVKEKEAPFLT